MTPNMKDPLLQALYVATYKLADEQLQYILDNATNEELQHFHVISQRQAPSYEQLLEGIKISNKYIKQYNTQL